MDDVANQNFIIIIIIYIYIYLTNSGYERSSKREYLRKRKICQTAMLPIYMLVIFPKWVTCAKLPAIQK